MKTFFKIIIFLVIYITGIFGLAMAFGEGRLKNFIGVLLGIIICGPAWDFWWEYISKTMDKKDEQ